MNYHIVLIRPTGYAHTPALWDVGRLLYHSFISLGFPTGLAVNRVRPDAINVVLGYHLLGDVGGLGKARVIFYQLEQLSQREGQFMPHNLEILKRAEEVWDYTPENAAFLRSRGLENVKLLPFGFHVGLQTIPEAPKEIDVLFYGSVNPRRQIILDALQQRCRLRVLFGVYGQQRDAEIARAKIVLNLHMYDLMIMEQARVSYLINNGCFVLSESSPHDPYEGMMATASYRDIPETCMRFLNDEPARRQVAQRGFELFRQRPMIQYLKAVLPA